ncbi:UDP-N-acetylglucosamine 2-epimerase [Alkalitalea saponilacus]|uniref:UDP-N-acetylglucosamine 2-epimerase (Hydrolysing) n=1 Tax=Alkalitalea saponilacus TaxID=889453 RepID=A0A1T5HS50_9BACT|nr:UDP-N-acetylglucosamine 2-epimerase [Alkalitalea saponilacus]ASB48305.1 UDP-N-acetylglucosamine 2-epimerase (hydrolyzing) [Alkalitalea saponilacus]SKC23528.1 UDP-N-acetylglucosamine 2-epimerase (hydrolysing) [Alkalitalea saponilacus]
MKKILFLTGTRADFGKLKSLMYAVEEKEGMEPHIFVTGMHMHRKYGLTAIEVEKCGFKNIYRYYNSTQESTMDLTLAKTIEGLSNYIREEHPDLIVVHGDRVEALAGAIAGALNNILVAHVEGGEVSGTIDELIRHSVSKMSHVHFVSNELARKRLIQMGELEDSIFTIGSPDIDVMFSDDLPKIEKVKEYYEIPFSKYGVLMFHPVTTEYEELAQYAENLVEAVVKSNLNYVVVYPNNDWGSDIILKAYESFKSHPNFKIFPSIRFEYFLVLIKNAKFMIGNSSAGIREAPYYGLPSVNIGTRQNNRALNDSIINCGYGQSDIENAIQEALVQDVVDASFQFGSGNSAQLFINELSKEGFWDRPKQKLFHDIVPAI